MEAPRIVRIADPDGRPVVYVEMTNCLGVFAIVDEADYDRLLAGGVSTRWFLNKPARNRPGLVRTSLQTVNGSTTTLARLVVDAGAGELVSYRSGQKLDLRRSNLVIRRSRRAKTRAALPSELVDEFAPLAPLPLVRSAGPFPAPGDYRWDNPTP